MMLRRQFLQTAGAAALASTGLARPAASGRAPAPSSSIQKARLLPGCCAYSYHDDLALLVSGIALAVNRTIRAKHANQLSLPAIRIDSPAPQATTDGA